MEVKQRGILNEHKAAIYTICAGAEDHIFYSGGSDRYVIRWNLKTMEAEKVVSKSPTTIVSLSLLKEQNILLIGQIEGGVHVIDLNENKELKYLKIHKGYIFDIQFIEEKNEVVFSSGDGTISIWSIPEFNLLFQTTVGEGKNRKLAYSAAREELAVASSDSFVQVFDTKDWRKKYTVTDLESGANSVVYTDSNLLIGTKNAHLHEYDLTTATKRDGIPAHNWAVYDLTYHAEYNVIASASRDKTVKFWNPEKLNVLKRLEGFKDKAHTHSVNTLLWTKYENLLITAGDDKMIRVWECVL